MSGLYIKGFKCFEEVTIPMRSLTVLAGGNSVGKSSVIQMLLLLRNAVENKYDKKTSLNDNYLLSLGDSSQILSRAAFDNEIVGKYEAMDTQFLEVYWNANTVRPQVYLDLIDKKTSNYDNDKYVLADNFHYLHAERLGPRSFYKVGSNDRNVGWKGENTISVLSDARIDTPTYHVRDSRVFSQVKSANGLYSSPLRKEVEQWMDYIIPGTNVDARRIQEISQAYVQYNDNKPYNVGFGISYILPIIVAGLLVRHSEMLIIENPEAHLHPSGQSRIGQFLARVASQGAQVIIETHSEHVINGIRLASLKKEIDNKNVVINFFSKSNEQGEQPIVESILLNEKADLQKWPIGFFDQQQHDLSKIFKIRKTL